MVRTHLPKQETQETQVQSLDQKDPLEEDRKKPMFRHLGFAASSFIADCLSIGHPHGALGGRTLLMHACSC